MAAARNLCGQVPFRLDERVSQNSEHTSMPIGYRDTNDAMGKNRRQREDWAAINVMRQ